MDPLSVIASITGILAVAAKITAAVTEFIGKERDAPRSMRSVLMELSDLTSRLAHLEMFVRGAKDAPKTRRDAISVEQIVAITTSLVLNMSELHKLLDSFNLDKPMSTSVRLRWLRSEEKINEILTRVGASKTSLNLILTIFTCTSLEKTQTSVWNLTTAVSRILEYSEDVSRRLANMENSILRLNQGTATASLMSLETSDVTSTISPLVRNTSDELESQKSNPQFDPFMESQLYDSRVYLRAIRRFSTLSLPSNTCSAPGMSFLSAVSLGQISNLSVIELPIFHHEIWDSRDYRLADDHGVKSSASRMNSSHSVPNFKAVSNNIRNSPGYVNDMRIKEWNFLKRVFRSRLKSEADAWLRNAQFEKELKRYRDEQMTGVKLALLGAALSGKTTVLKQMRTVYSEGFRDEERRRTRQIIFSNIMKAFEDAMIVMHDSGLQYSLPTSPNHEQMLKTHSVYFLFDAPLPKPCLTPMRELYADEGFRSAIALGNQTALFDNFQYYNDNIDRLFSPGYLPNDMDILLSYKSTSGIQETPLRLDGKKYHVFDCGGTWDQRKSLLHVSSLLRSIVCCSSLSGYDQFLFEVKDEKNQMQESLALFESLVSSKELVKCSMILLLTKLDLFKLKIQRSPIKQYFPDYTGEDKDVEAAKDFFVNKFLSLNNDPGRKVHVFCTDVTDSDDFSPVMRNIMRIAAERPEGEEKVQKTKERE